LNKEIRGICPPIPTPFDGDGEILHDVLRENLRRWVAAGLHGFVVLGSNGEYVMMDKQEKQAVWATAREMIPTDRLFIAGTGADSTRETIRQTRMAADCGADAALVVTPHYYRPQMTSAAWIQHYKAVADVSPIPVLVYNVPPYTNVDIDAATMLELAGHANIAGMKDSSGNLAKLAEIIRFAPARFTVMAGTGSAILPAMALGARGAVPALANIAPRECVELFGLCSERNFDAARELQLRLIRPNAAVTTRWGVPGLKAALDLLGYYGGPTRAPLQGLGEAERDKLRGVLREAKLLE
jgi:4-hydroxy-2-oxoglutarate aldolase